MRSIPLAFCLLLVTACSSGSPASPSPIDQEVVLAPGQSAPIVPAGIALRFLGVANDSRCPADAMCVLGGSASVDVQVTSFSGGAQVLRFETGDPRAVQLGRLTLALVQLAPYPFSAQPINPAEYRATLRVTR
jgi:hypothetical protein